MAVSVQFCINIDGNVCLEEDKLSSDSNQSDLIKNENFVGAIIIRTQDGIECRIKDELEATVQNLCFLSIQKLKMGQNVVIKYFSYYGYLRLDPEGDTVVISGDFVPKIRVPSEELTLNLYNCGVRFVEFFQGLRGQDADYARSIQHLKQQAEEAKSFID